MLTLINTRIKNCKKGQGQRGFTLIEVLVSLAIFAIGIIACYAMQVRSTATAGRANSVATSSTWATYLMEDFLTLDYTDPLLENSKGDTANGLTNIDDTATGNPDGTMHVRPNGTVGSTSVAGDLYSVYWNVADNRPMEGLKQIRITVVKNNGLSAGVLYSQDYYKLNPNF